MTSSISPAAPLTSIRHEHGWVSESSHVTSEGTVVYVRCAACDARRVDLLRDGAQVPTRASAVIAEGRGTA